MLKDRLLSQVLESIFSNTVSLGAGLILLLAARAMRDNSFSVGDFALFVYYLNFVTGCTQFFGQFLAHYTQTGVSFERMVALLQGAPPNKLVKHSPLHLSGPLPDLPPIADRGPAPVADRGAERWPGRGPGHTRRAAGDLRGDAPALAWRGRAR
jgi:ATP-binding cassette, subfamily B, bacterial